MNTKLTAADKKQIIKEAKKEMVAYLKEKEEEDRKMKLEKELKKEIEKEEKWFQERKNDIEYMIQCIEFGKEDDEDDYVYNYHRDYHDLAMKLKDHIQNEINKFA